MGGAGEGGAAGKADKSDSDSDDHDDSEAEGESEPAVKDEAYYESLMDSPDIPHLEMMLEAMKMAAADRGNIV